MASYQEPGEKKEKGKPSSAKPYMKAIDAYEAEFEKWEKRCDKIVKRYRDERDDIDKGSQRFNIFWANIDITSSALFAKPPAPEVERRFRDKDIVARQSSKLIERAVAYEIDTGEFERAVQRTVTDYLLTGRGSVWELYEPTMDGKRKTDERTETLFLGYKEFGHDVCRRWPEVKKVWRKVYFTKEQAKERWPNADEEKFEYGTDYVDDKAKTEDVQKKTCVYEVWCKPEDKVYWVSKNQSNILESYDFPLDLRNKFPCPEPLYATETNDTLIPTPDYVQYQDQILQIDRITARIGHLTDALKVVGVYDSTVPELQRLLHPSGVQDNTLVPVKNWKMFAGKGGLSSSVELIPLKEVADALISLYQALEQAKGVLYEVTGLADIIRGATDPNETLGAQELKSRHGSLRIRKRQAAVARFVRDALRIKAEIICEHFEPDTLWAMTNAESFIEPMQPPPPELQQAPPEIQQQFAEQAKRQAFEQCVELLRDDRMRTFRLDIETDSTIQLDEVQSKQDAVEFITAFGTFMKGAAEIVAMDPRIAPLAGEIMTYMARQYKAGRQLESAIEAYVDQLKQPQPPKQDPEMMKVEAEAKAREQELQMEAQFKEKEIQLKGQEIQAKTQLKLVETQAKIEGEQQKMAMEAESQQQEMQMKQRMGQQEMAMRQAEGEQQMALQREQGQQQAAIAREKNHMDAENKREAARAKK